MGAAILAEAPFQDVPSWVWLVVALLLLAIAVVTVAFLLGVAVAGVLVGRYARRRRVDRAALPWVVLVAALVPAGWLGAVTEAWTTPVAAFGAGVVLGLLDIRRGAGPDDAGGTAPSGPPPPPPGPAT